MEKKLPILEKTSHEAQIKINQEFQKLSEEKSLLPIKVTSFYRKKIEEEVGILGHTEGPLHRISYPSQEKIALNDSAEVADFLNDRFNMTKGIPNVAIRKYKDRILFMPTSVCAGHCQYCFRQDVLTEHNKNSDNDIENKLVLLKKYLKENKEITEVILSGGDPMILPLKKLELIIRTLKEDVKIESIRIHTKTICYAPHVFHDEQKLQLLAEAKVRMVFHIAHPYEICEEVKQTIQYIRSEGIRCYNQFPILRKINDHADLLNYHIKRLDNLEIRNLSIFLPEPVFHSAAFRINLHRLFKIMDDFNWNSPSWINSTRFVLDTPIGKVRRENLLSYDYQKCLAVFEREGKKVVYPDLPSELDKPGDLDTMLWKGII
jgi:KamA family protein